MLEYQVGRRRASRGGYTLIEIVIVIVIIGLIVMFAAPRINLSGIRSKAAVQSVGTTLLAMQRDAITRQHNVVVGIDQATRSFLVVYDSTNDQTLNNSERSRTVPLSEEIVIGKPAAVPAQPFGGAAVNFVATERASGLPAIIFLRNGSAQETGGFYMSTPKAMAGAPGHENETWALQVIRATGRAEWQRWNGTSWVRGY
jgi:prepilin-type N-terminal cleavage/methylation domain-containing protein